MLERLTGLSLAADARAAIFASLPPLAASPVPPARRAAIMREIDDRIARRDFRVVGAADDRSRWRSGWGEVADALRRAEHADLEALKPQYFHRGVPFRLFGEYAIGESDYFEYYAGVALRRQLLLASFPGCTRLVELGCGTGMNLIIAAELFPAAALVGGDWVRPSLDILDIIARRLGRDVRGVLCNLATGEGCEAVAIDPASDVLTVHALEQLGEGAGRTVDWLIAKRPRRCLHIEPILDFYDRSQPFDDIAARYHLARGYLVGLWPLLQHRATEGAIEIVAHGRVQLGNLYHEAYSYISWRPA